MEFVASSAFAFLLLAALLATGPQRGLWLFFVATPFGAAAAFNLPAAGNASVLVADLAARAFFVLVALRRDGLNMIAGSMRWGQPGFWLLLYAVFAIFATILFPIIFRGQTEVFAISRAISGKNVIMVPLQPTAGNLTQLVRLVLGVSVFFALATIFRRAPDPRPIVIALAVAALGNALLGWIDVTAWAIGLDAILDPVRTANYALHDNVRMAGLKRMIGGFPEASSFGYFAIGVFAFWLQYWLLRPKSRMATIIMLITLIAVLRSTSSAAYVSFAVLIPCIACIGVLRNLRTRVPVAGFAVATTFFIVGWMFIIALVSAYQLLEPVQAFFERALFGKLEGVSGVERSSWNAQAFVNFVETWGFGTGLGSSRASSWVFATLSSVGAVGTLLIGLFLVSLFSLPRGDNLHDDTSVVLRSLKVACFAWLMSAMLTQPTPDLGLAFFACAGLAAGLSRGTNLAAQARNRYRTETLPQLWKQFGR